MLSTIAITVRAFGLWYKITTYKKWLKSLDHQEMEENTDFNCHVKSKEREKFHSS